MGTSKTELADVFSAIRLNYHSLSTIQRQIADYILKVGNQAMYLSISDLAQKCSTSETTIMRFLRKIGYDSYQVFRVHLAQISQQENPKYAWSDIVEDDSIGEITEKIVASTVAAIEDIRSLVPAESIESVVRLILNARRILVFGFGSSAYIAGDFFHKLVRLGLDVVSCNDPHVMAIHSSHVNPGDLCIAVSHSGESDVIISSAQTVKKRGGDIVAITSYPHSTLAGIADWQLLSSTNETNYRPDAMTSRILQLVIIDVLTVTLTRQLGQNGIDAIARSQVAVARLKK